MEVETDESDVLGVETPYGLYTNRSLLNLEFERLREVDECLFPLEMDVLEPAGGRILVEAEDKDLLLLVVCERKSLHGERFSTNSAVLGWRIRCH